MDSLDWSKTFAILSISRLYLRDTLRMPINLIESLSDEDMSRIADILIAQRFDAEFEEDVVFTVMAYLVERDTDNRTTGKEKPFELPF
jgi:hypothetical protein